MLERATRYAKSGDVNIAYQVVGDGPFDVVVVPPFISHLELLWEVPTWAAFNERLASSARVILFDKRGTGMSDRVPGMQGIEARMDDIRAVMAAAGSRRAALLGISDGAALAILFAAVYVECVWALALWGAMPRRMRAADFPWGIDDSELKEQLAAFDAGWGDPGRIERLAEWCLPEADAAERQALVAMYRLGASPGTARAMLKMNAGIDVRPALAAISVPTFVGWRADEPEHIREGSRLIAGKIADVTRCELPGSGHLPFARADGAVDALEAFLGEAWQAPDSGRTAPSPRRRPAPVWPAGLTDREVDVLRAIARGLLAKEVALELGISVRTVNHHVAHIYEKVGVRTRAGIALFALEHGLLAEPDGPAQ